MTERKPTPPPRKQSDLTIPIPRSALPPPASSSRLPEDEDEREAARNAITLVPCPWCEGHGMVAPETRYRWTCDHPELRAELDDPAEEPKP